MSNWLAMLIGLIIGLFIGLLLGREKYRECEQRLKKLTQDLHARQDALKETTSEVAAMEGRVQRLTAEVDAAKAAAATRVASATAASAAVAAAPATRAASDSAQAVDEVVTECPQKLARIKGIGRVYEEKLYQAGVGSFWQIVEATDDFLAQVFDIKDFQAVDLDAIRQFAMEWAEKTNTKGWRWSGRKPDDLENLPGIGKTYEGRLYDAGVCTWAALAALSPEELAAILKAPEWNQPDYAAWIAYAKAQLA